MTKETSRRGRGSAPAPLVVRDQRQQIRQYVRNKKG